MGRHVMKSLQGTVLRSVGAVRNYEQSLHEWLGAQQGASAAV